LTVVYGLFIILISIINCIKSLYYLISVANIVNFVAQFLKQLQNGHVAVLFIFSIRLTSLAHAHSLRRLEVKSFFKRFSNQLIAFKEMGKIQYYTEEGLNRLKAELQDLKTRGRHDIAHAIAEARDKGDLSENAEYDAAKDAQGLLEGKIAKLETVLSNARLIDESVMDASVVSVLSKVKIKNKKNDTIVTYTLVSEEEADLKAGKISIGSPIGKGLVGKKAGDLAEIRVPAGILEFEVLEISR
jgi:transcription elongation factor GreA